MTQHLKCLCVCFVAIGVFFLLSCEANKKSKNQTWTNPERPACVKTVGSSKVVPLYKESSGTDSQKEVSSGTAVTILRSKNTRSLVRVKGSKISGWIETQNIGSCSTISNRTKVHEKSSMKVKER